MKLFYNKKTLNLFCLLVAFIFFYIPLFRVEAAANQAVVAGCTVRISMVAPTGTRTDNTVLINKDKLDGYTLSFNTTGDSCNLSQVYAQYSSSGVKDSKTTFITEPSDSTCHNLMYWQNTSQPIGFAGLESYSQIILNVDIFNTGTTCTGTKSSSLKITARWPSTSTSGGSGNQTPPTKQTPPEPPVSDPKNGTIDTTHNQPTVPKLYNPLKNNSLIGLGFKLLQGFFIGVAAFAVVFIVLGALQLVVSRGNPEALTKGKDTIIWSLLGVVVALMAFSLIGIVQNILGAYQ